MVHNYLVHSGYAESVHAFEQESAFDELKKVKIEKAAKEFDDLIKNRQNIKR